MSHGVAGFFGSLSQGTSRTAKGLSAAPFRIKFALVHFLLVLTLLFNASSWYGENASQQTTILLLYLVSIVFAFVSFGRPNPLAQISTGEFLLTFAFYGIAGVVLFKLLAPISPPAAELSTTSIAVILTHAFVVAVGEELLFRYFVPGVLESAQINKYVAQLVSAVIFGALHWTAYGGNLGAIAFAASLGAVFGLIAGRFKNGLIITIALHAAYNISVIGGV